MSKPISLNQARKAKQKAAKADQAAANRVRFGRTKAEKLRDKEAANKIARDLDGAETQE